MATFVASDSSSASPVKMSSEPVSTTDLAVADLIEATAQLEMASGGTATSKSGAIEATAGAVEETLTSSATATSTGSTSDVEPSHRPDENVPPAAYRTPDITLISSITELDTIEPWLKRQSRIAIDAEGVNLSRVGSLTVLSMAVELPVSTGIIPAHVFLFDMIHSDVSLRRRQTSLLKYLTIIGLVSGMPFSSPWMINDLL